MLCRVHDTQRRFLEVHDSKECSLHITHDNREYKSNSRSLIKNKRKNRSENFCQGKLFQIINQ